MGIMGEGTKDCIHCQLLITWPDISPNLCNACQHIRIKRVAEEMVTRKEGR